MSLTPARKPKARATTSLFEGQSTAFDAESSDDFVDVLAAMVVELLPEMQGDRLADLKAAVRDRWGGDRPFIARRAGEGRSGRNQAIRADFQRGERVAFLARRYHLHRAQIYRILGLPEE